MKRLGKAVAIVSLLTLTATAAVAASGGNPRKGKFLYQKNCKVCHVEGGSAVNLSANSRTQGQWDRFFDRDGHKANADAWKGLSAQDLKDIQQYLFNHAADSDQPETCG